MIHQVGSFYSEKTAYKFLKSFQKLFNVPLSIQENRTSGALVRRFDILLDEEAYIASCGMAHLSVFPHYFDSVLVTLRSAALSMNAKKEIKRLKKRYPRRFPIC